MINMKYFILIVLIISFFSKTECYSQNLKDLLGPESDSLIIWTKSRKLNWNDFKAKKNSEEFGDAISETGINIMPNYNYKFFAIFFKINSWTNTKSELSLKHEQVHFDIAELFARKMRKEICKLKLKNKTLYNIDYKLIYKEYYGKLRSYQKLYDLETNHSKVFKMQKKWEKKVAKELDELEEFSLKIESNN